MAATNESYLKKSRHFRDKLYGTGRHWMVLHEQTIKQGTTGLNVMTPLGTPAPDLQNRCSTSELR